MSWLIVWASIISFVLVNLKSNRRHNEMHFHVIYLHIHQIIQVLRSEKYNVHWIPVWCGKCVLLLYNNKCTQDIYYRCFKIISDRSRQISIKSNVVFNIKTNKLKAGTNDSFHTITRCAWRTSISRKKLVFSHYFGILSYGQQSSESFRRREMKNLKILNSKCQFWSECIHHQIYVCEIK